MSRHATPRHATPRHATPRHATLRCATPRHAAPHHAAPRHSSGVISAPLLALYAATKAFVDKFSRDLNIEYAPYNISVQSQTPFWITTKLASIREKYANFTTPTPKTYAKSSIARIGYGASNYGYWFHDLAGWMINTISGSGLEGVLNRAVLRMHKGIRKRGIKKRERKAKEAKKGQ